jgi:hypothetical protein
LVRNCLQLHTIEEEYADEEKQREDEEEDANSYWMILRKREYTGDRKRQHWIALCGKFASVDAMGLSYERICNADEDDDGTTTMTGPVRNFKTEKISNNDPSILFYNTELSTTGR